MKACSVQFYAYHGTLKSSAKAITEGKCFKQKSCRDNHWLGQGAYFFREDYEQALIWAQTKRKNSKEEPAVLEVLIHTENNHILNLDSRKGLELLSEFIDSLMRKEKIALGIDEMAKDSSKIACFIFSLLPKEQFWVIQRTFDVPSKGFDTDENIQILAFTHKDFKHSFQLQGTQICVRNPSAIDKNSIKIINETYNE